MTSRKVKAESSTSEVKPNIPEFNQPTLTPELAGEAEVTTVIPEVIEELSENELQERHQLELKVERAFVEAGKALRELRSRRLYRNTHRTFEAYCLDRFAFGRAHSYRLIDAARVFDNLVPEEELNNLSPNRRQILPTKLEQVRPLIPLEAEEQCQVWDEAVEAAGGRVPSGRIVKSIVERLKEKPLPQIPLSYKRNDAFILQGLTGPERRYNNCWAIAREILEFSLIVETHDGSLQVKPDNLERIDDRSVRRQVTALLRRIQKLRKCELDRGAEVLLESFGKRTFLTEVEEKLLMVLENHYGIA